MKKLLALILALVMCFSLVACGGDEKKDDEAAKSPAASQGSNDKKDDAAADKKDDAASELSVADEWRAKSEGEEYNILYIPSWAASEYFVNSYAVWKEQLAELGWNMDMQGPKEYNAESQLATLEAALLSGEYDAILLYPIVPDTVNAVLDELWDTYQVPIIQWGFPEEHGGGQYFIAPDDRYAAVGDYMTQMVFEYVEDNMDYFKSEYLDKGEKIPYGISGGANNPVQNVRILRCIENLDADGRFEMVFHSENLAEKDTQAYGETIALNNPEVEIIMCYNDGHAVNFDAAFKTTGGMKDTMRMFATDGTRALVSLLKEEGEDCYIYGTSGSNHTVVGNILIDIFKGAIPAAQEGEIVPELTVEAKAAFAAAIADGSAQDNISWKNCDQFFND